MSNDTKNQARREVNPDASARETATGSVMMAMVIATIIGITSAMSFSNRQVETPASEATEQSLQQTAVQSSPLPAQSSSNQVFQQSVQPPLQQPIAQQPVQQPVQQPRILPSEPIN